MVQSAKPFVPEGLNQSPKDDGHHQDSGNTEPNFEDDIDLD